MQADDDRHLQDHCVAAQVLEGGLDSLYGPFALVVELVPQVIGLVYGLHTARAAALALVRLPSRDLPAAGRLPLARCLDLSSLLADLDPANLRLTVVRQPAPPRGYFVRRPRPGSFVRAHLGLALRRLGLCEFIQQVVEHLQRAIDLSLQRRHCRWLVHLQRSRGSCSGRCGELGGCCGSLDHGSSVVLSQSATALRNAAPEVSRSVGPAVVLRTCAAHAHAGWALLLPWAAGAPHAALRRSPRFLWSLSQSVLPSSRLCMCYD